jgi:hypothetical protein
MIQLNDVGIANLKFLLLSFENMSGLKINFSKSEVLVLGLDHIEQRRIANLLNYILGTFPITYLGLPVSDKRLSLKDWEPLTGPWSTWWIPSRVNSCHLPRDWN